MYCTPGHVLIGVWWQGELREVDILIQHPRPLDVVDVIVEFVDANTRSLLQDPSVFRLVPPLTNWALTWSLQQAFHYEAGLAGGSDQGQWT